MIEIKEACGNWLLGKDRAVVRVLTLSAKPRRHLEKEG